MQELKEGSQLQGGKYRIIRMLGQGGFGITYEGVQTGLERRVAIKEFFMKEYCNRDGLTSQVSVGSQGSRDMVNDFRVKFLKEAQLIARMEDAPHVVRIHDIFEENGTAYYVMEFLGGGSLNDMLKREGPMPEFKAIGFIRQIGEALTYLHDQNTLHLDIKPSNVLINKKGEAVLIDFGVSKHYDQSGSQTSSTPVGLSKGFAPTEQYQSGGVQQFTPATDVYSLGATLYNLLTGQVPPEASAVFEDGLPPRPHYISQQTWAAIEQAMQPRRKDRTQTVAEFLGALSASSPVLKPKPKPAPKPQPAPGTSETVVAQPTTHTAKGDFFAIGITVTSAASMLFVNHFFIQELLRGLIKSNILLGINFMLLLGVGLTNVYFVRKNYPCRRWLRWLSVISMLIYAVYCLNFVYRNFL